MADDKKLMGEKRTLFGKQEDEVVDALEAIWKKMREQDEKLDQIMQAMATALPFIQKLSAAPAEGAAGTEDVPGWVKWAATQPWGAQLLGTVTNQEMIGGLVKSLIEWLKTKAVAKATEAIAGATTGTTPPAA